MYNAFDNEFTELLPPDSWSHECAKFLLDSDVHRFINVPLMVEIGVEPCMPRLVERCELTVLDERLNTEAAGEPTKILVTISLVAGFGWAGTRPCLDAVQISRYGQSPNNEIR